MIPLVRRLVLIVLLAVLLGGCAAYSISGRAIDRSGPVSSLAQAVSLTPLRGQSVEQTRQDDRECERWTRGTKGPNEPLPNAKLRYAACVIARGYQADVAHPSDLAQIAKGWHVSAGSSERPIATVLAEWQACRMDKADIPAFARAPFADTAHARAALACLAGRGYRVELFN
jgi:hypothetical protein